MNPNFLRHITPIVLTFNEAPNIARILSKLFWAREIVVVDSGSTDGTLDILQRHAQVRTVHRAFDSHAAQWNFALTQTGINTDWVLAMDADYVLTDDLVAELSQLDPSPETLGYRMRFRYCIAGQPLRATLYPPVTTLFRRSRGRYLQDGHTQRLALAGQVLALQAPALHDDRKPLQRWLWAQNRYAALECDVLLSKPWRQLRLQDRLRSLIVITPWLVPLYCLTVGRGALDGWPGLYYALQRGVAEAVLSLRLLEARMNPNEIPR